MSRKDWQIAGGGDVWHVLHHDTGFKSLVWFPTQAEAEAWIEEQIRQGQTPEKE